MNAKLKPRRNEHEEIVKKLDRLSILATEFLEKSFSKESLAGDWTEMERLKKILRDNLWQGNINPDDPDWCPDTPDEFAGMLLYFHRLTTEGFWIRFKEELRSRQMMRGPIIAPMGYEWMADHSQQHIDAFIKIETPDTPMTVRCCLDDTKVHFFRSSVDAIPALLDLLQGLPLDRLRFCGNKECGAFFVQKTAHAKKFCSGSCQSIQYQRELRAKDPEAHRSYHQQYYQKTKEKQRLEKEQRRKKLIARAKGGMQKK